MSWWSSHFPVVIGVQFLFLGLIGEYVKFKCNRTFGKWVDMEYVYCPADIHLKIGLSLRFSDRQPVIAGLSKTGLCADSAMVGVGQAVVGAE